MRLLKWARGEPIDEIVHRSGLMTGLGCGFAGFSFKEQLHSNRSYLGSTLAVVTPIAALSALARNVSAASIFNKIIG